MNKTDIFDYYGDFNRVKYFFEKHGILPSRANLELPVPSKKKIMQEILSILAPDTAGLQILYKEWKIARNKNASESQDFANEYFYVSQNQKLCIYLYLRHEDIEIEFLYDHTRQEMESWVLKSIQKIRNQYGKPQSPVFKVLTKGTGGYYTEDINIDNFEIEVNKHYNDDFIPIDSIINNSLTEDRSGLILLHGDPGTGKTSYIKNLLTRHNEKNFIFIPNDFINELLQPDFITFLISHKNAILVIEDAEKVIASRENESKNSVVSTILQLTDGLFSDYLNIKIICTFNTQIGNIDKALLRKGRMTAFYHFKALNIKKTNAILESFGYKGVDKELTLADIFNFENNDFEKSDKKKSIGFKSSYN